MHKEWERKKSPTLRPKSPKICYTYPTKIKLGTVISHLKRTEKGTYHPLFFSYIIIFPPKLAIFVISRNKDQSWILTFIESFIVCFNQHDCNFDGFDY